MLKNEKQALKEVCASATEKKIEEKEEKFFKKITNETNKAINTKHRDDELKSIMDNLRKTFGESNWKKLTTDSQKSIISAAYMWQQCKDMNDPNFDYSGICICATSALEREMKHYFFTKYKID